MTPREAAQMQFDPAHPPHHRSPNGFSCSLIWR
jgi:hypothetical protein